jgi:hypothetical protein
MSRTDARIDRAVAALEPSRAEATRSRLRRIQTDCGCREGALLMLAATLATALQLALQAEPRPAATVALTLVGVLFGSAAVGKAIGLAIARVRLLVALSRLERAASPLPSRSR